MLHASTGGRTASVRELANASPSVISTQTAARRCSSQHGVGWNAQPFRPRYEMRRPTDHVVAEAVGPSHGSHASFPNALPPPAGWGSSSSWWGVAAGRHRVATVAASNCFKNGLEPNSWPRRPAHDAAHSPNHPLGSLRSFSSRSVSSDNAGSARGLRPASAMAGGAIAITSSSSSSTTATAATTASNGVLSLASAGAPHGGVGGTRGVTSAAAAGVGAGGGCGRTAGVIIVRAGSGGEPGGRDAGPEVREPWAAAGGLRSNSTSSGSGGGGSSSGAEQEGRGLPPPIIISPVALRVVVVGWMGSSRRYLNKYGALWARSGDHEVLMIRPSVMSTLVRWRGVVVAGRDIDRVARLHRENPAMPTVYHVFSTGGFIHTGTMWRWMDEVEDVAQRRDLLEEVRGIIFDSAPAAINPEMAARAIVSAVTNTPAEDLKYGMPGIQGTLLSGTRTFLDSYLRTNGVRLRAEEVYDAWYNLAPVCPQLYLYSDADPLVPPSDVERYMAVQEGRGVDVSSHVFRGSGHVEHFRRHPHEYAYQISAFLARALADW